MSEVADEERMAAKKHKGPMFLRFVPSIIETLKELGNSGTPGEVADRVVERLKISEKEQEETTSNGQARVRAGRCNRRTALMWRRIRWKTPFHRALLP